MKNSVMKKMLLVIATMMFTLSLAFGATSVHAASLKSTAKKQISAAVKKQYNAVKKYAKKTNYKIESDKKAGKLKKNGKNYEQVWKITLAASKTNLNLAVEVKNTYSKKTKKIKTGIHVDVVSDGVKVGNGEELKSVTALKKLMKKCSTEKGVKAYLKEVKKKSEDSFQANWWFSKKSWYCKYCKITFYNYWDYVVHNLFPDSNHISRKWWGR